MDIFGNIGLGLETALTTTNLMYCFLGVLIGTLAGVLPGINALSAISMLFPITFYLEPTTALIMLSGIWYGVGYGGRTASILLNIPGTIAASVTCLDGYPMAQQGRGGVALLMTTVSSFIGGSIGILFLMFFAPTIAAYASRFGAAEYFSLILLGLVGASTVSDGSTVKSLAMVVLGIMLGCVGQDMYTGSARYVFGVLNLMDGLSLVALAMGIFGVAEVVAGMGRTSVGDFDRKSVQFRAMMPTRDDIRRSWMPVLRGTSIGSFFGTLPGTGASIAAFMAYAVEKRVAREPQRFGKGAIEGIMAPEAADNAAEMTAFIPTFSLGIPGSATMALMLGVLMIHGISPGPTLISEQPSLFWGLIMSFWIGNVLLVILNAPMVGIWVRILLVPYHLLFPAVLAFVCIGAYSVSFSSFDVWLVAAFGLLGYVMRIFQWPGAPVLIGFVLGPMLEEEFRRAMIVSRGNLMTFVERPISGAITAVTIALLVWSAWSAYRQWKKRRAVDVAVGDAVPGR